MNGRVFCQGFDFAHGTNSVFCFDAYNGVRYWKREIPDSLRLGMPSVSGNLAADADSVFVAAADKCHRLDAATGETRAVFATPRQSEGSAPAWLSVAVADGLLVGSAESLEREKFADTVFAYEIVRGHGVDGERDGIVCTSSNAAAVLRWAYERGEQVLFFPDQHLGRNTGFTMGYGPDDMQVWDPHRDHGGCRPADVERSVLLLWKGHCSVHQRFRVEHVEAARRDHPDVEVIVHPECAHEVVELADRVGSTERIQEWVTEAPTGATLAIGTEIHMVQRLARAHPDKTIFTLDPLVCPCSTMFRIDAPHLAWVLERLVAGEVVNRITVDPDTRQWARVALDRMLEIA